MKTKQYIVLAVVLLIAGCKSAKQPVYQLPPIKHIERTVTKLVPIFMPADSATIKAHFECDSLNNVLMREIGEVKSNRMASSFDFIDGLFRYNIKTKPDTVYLPSDSVFIENEVPYPVEVDKIIYQQTKWQRFFYLIGIIATTAIVVWLIMKLGLKRIL